MMRGKTNKQKQTEQTKNPQQMYPQTWLITHKKLQSHMQTGFTSLS